MNSIDVLRRYFSFNRSSTENAKISNILNDIKIFYGALGVAIIATEHIRLKLKKIIKDAKTNISKRKSNSPYQIKSEDEFFNKISAPFDITKRNEFNENSSNEPIPSCSYHFIAATNENADNSYYVDNSGDSEYEISSDCESTEDVLFVPRKKMQISDEILKKIDSSSTFHTSYEDMSTYIKIGIEMAGGDPNNYSVSKSQIFKQLTELRNSKREETLMKLSDGNSKLLVHFDTKSCHKLDKRHLGHQNRLVVIFRSDSFATTIGPLKIDNHESNTIARTITDLIETYHLESRIVALSCDTEFANTGRLNGVCPQLERFLGRQLLHW